MTSQSNISTLESAITEALSSAGYRLYGYRWHHGQEALVVYLDDIENPVTVDDCAQAAKHLQNFLALLPDSEPGSKCALEVSSPGVCRQLFTLEHFQRVVGQSVEIKLKRTQILHDSSGAAVKKVRGLLSTCDDQSVVVKDGEETVTVLHGQIASACLSIDWPDSDFKKSGRKLGDKNNR